MTFFSMCRRISMCLTVAARGSQILAARYVGIDIEVSAWLPGHGDVLDNVTLASSRPTSAMVKEYVSRHCPECMTSAAFASTSVNVSRVMRKSIVDALYHADGTGLAKLSWELDDTAAEVSRFGGAKTTARIGLFVIHKGNDGGVLRLMVSSLVEAFDETAVSSANFLQIHSLTGYPKDNSDHGYDTSFWLQVLDTRTSFLGGVHLCDSENFLRHTRRAQGNYMHKVWTMIVVSRFRGYTHLVSADDDILVPPATFRALAWAALDAKSGHTATGCGVTTPLIHNAVPTGRMFFEHALGLDGPAALSQLDECFSRNARTLERYLKIRLTEPLDPWNETRWWNAVATARTVYKGVHPIRQCHECMILAWDLAMARVEHWWPVEASPSQGAWTLQAYGPGVKPFSYFTDTFWMAEVEHYASAMMREDLFVDKYDEVALNRYTIQEAHGSLCILPQSFVFHPSYNTFRGKHLRIVNAIAKVRAVEEQKLDRIRRVAIVAVCTSPLQNSYFWPSYFARVASSDHHLIVVHHNRAYLLDDNLRAANISGHVRLLNKVLKDGSEVPHQGFGAYQFAYRILKQDYDVFGFVQDSTCFRRDHWLRDAMHLLFDVHHKIGFVAAQVFNGNDLGKLGISTRYPHKSHIRSAGPIFVRTSVLNDMNWDFNSDDDGKMRFADDMVATGIVGVQIGNKLNFAYDSVGVARLTPMAKGRPNDLHITQILETQYFSEKNQTFPFRENEFDFFEKLLSSLSPRQQQAELVRSPSTHSGHTRNQRVFYDIQPFNNLIYSPSLIKAQELFGHRIVQLTENAYSIDMSRPDFHY